MTILSSRLQIAQKFFQSKIDAHQVNAGLYMNFKHRISFTTDFAANFLFWLQSIQNHAMLLLTAI